MIKFSPPRRARYGTGAHKVHTVRSDSIAQGRETFLGVLSARRDRMTTYTIPWNPGTHIPVQEVSASTETDSPFCDTQVSAMHLKCGPSDKLCCLVC